MAAGDDGLDSGRETARPSSGRVGIGAGQDEAAWGAKNRAGAAGFGRCDTGGGTARLSSARARGERREGENGLGHRDGISTARAAVESNGAATRGHKRRERRRAVPSRREAERGKRRDAGDGSLVIRPKFRMVFCKLDFSLFSWPQMKNF